MTVELYGLEVRGQRTLLRWRPTGKKLEPFSQTWYRVVDDEIVANCEIALAEGCETQDRDLPPEASEEDGSEDAVIDEFVASRSTDLSKCCSHSSRWQVNQAHIVYNQFTDTEKPAICLFRRWLSSLISKKRSHV
jgi:hypothetical protein